MKNGKVLIKKKKIVEVQCVNSVQGSRYIIVNSEIVKKFIELPIE